METFADYILSEKDFGKKLEIVYYMEKREKIFFDNSVILKADIARLFIETMKLDVDENLVLTACLLYACKKNIMSHDLNAIKRYALDRSKIFTNTWIFEKILQNMFRGESLSRRYR